jgi:hypothetical protein
MKVTVDNGRVQITGEAASVRRPGGPRRLSTPSWRAGRQQSGDLGYGRTSLRNIDVLCEEAACATELDYT